MSNEHDYYNFQDDSAEGFEWKATRRGGSHCTGANRPDGHHSTVYKRDDGYRFNIGDNRSDMAFAPQVYATEELARVAAEYHLRRLQDPTNTLADLKMKWECLWRKTTNGNLGRKTETGRFCTVFSNGDEFTYVIDGEFVSGFATVKEAMDAADVECLEYSGLQGDSE